MKTFSAALVICATVVSAPAIAQVAGADASRIQRDVARLASDQWEGRATCSPGLDAAAAFIAARFASLGLAGGATVQQGAPGFLHRYQARPSMKAHTPLASCATQNVVGIVRGSDPVLANEYVIVGAHYDHLGRDSSSATDRRAGDAIRNGADDNASGTAGVMELARLFKAHPAKRSLVFVAFSGEEWGFLGSSQFASDMMVAGRTQLMVNFDMIGRLRSDKLLVYGTGTAPELPAALERANTGTPFKLSMIPDGEGPSDHTTFYKLKIPVLHFFTDTHEDYHAATDDADKINAAGTARVLDYAARVIRDVADHNATLAFTPTKAVVRPATSGGPQPYLGSSPDMSAGDVPGQRISSVTAGSPGDKAGMKAGDIVVELAGKPVTDLSTYAAALYAQKPGDTITIVVLREGKRVTLTVLLTTRGG